MGASIFWAIVIAALLLMWFLPGRRTRRPGRSAAGARLISGDSARSEDHVREVARQELFDRGTGGQGQVW